MMKLVMAIVSSDDSREVLEKLSEAGFTATITSSTGGFLRISNTTLYCGVEEDQVEQVLGIIREISAQRTEHAPHLPPAESGLAKSVAVPPRAMGRATIFVLDVAHFEQV